MTILFRNELALLLVVEVLTAVFALLAAPVWLRLLFGLPALLFIPGYMLTCALFPSRNDLDGIERVALSVGFSVVIIPLLALVLHYGGWGIRLVPILVALLGFVGVMSLLAWVRRRGLGAEEAVVATFAFTLGRWRDASAVERASLAVIAAALGVAVIAMTVTVAMKDRYALTEFYVLGSGGLAEFYPREATVGQPVTVTVGIANQEDTALTYRVEVHIQGQPVGGAGPLSLGVQEVWQEQVSLTPPAAGKEQEVRFLLFRAGDDQPYRTLRLWLNVQE